MRIGRFALLPVTLCVVAALVTPNVASAWSHKWHHHPPRHNYGLTIAATPNPIVAGEGVLIYGKLEGSAVANQPIYLYHRIDPAARFTLISVTRTNSFGFYEFTRAEGIVMSNRNWYVLGPDGTHSRTMHEWVSSVVTLSAPTTTADTGTPIQFSGTVSPSHPFERVLLQEQNSASGNGWQTIASTVTNSASSFTLTHGFRAPGSYTLRALFQGDVRNLAGQSTPVTVTVQQQQNPSFTISGSAPVVSNGQTVTISGTLFAPGSTTTPQPSVPVTLYGAQSGGGFRALESTTTGANGAYSFTQMPLHNAVYRVLTQPPHPQHTANLYVGVQDVVTIGQSASTAPVGGTVTISGTVTPSHAGHVIYLQQLDAAGNWQDVAVGYLSARSTYSFPFTYGQAGTVQLRAEIPGGPVNVGGDSAPVTVTVSGVAPATSLPPAS